jgi:hypothetical protein
LQQGAGNQAVKALLGGGKPLPGGLRTEMEQRFGADFRDVRIHNDSAGHAAAEAMGAKAFTYGSDVVFSRDRFSPGTAEGRHLLAHELAHVLQQRAGKLIQSADAEAFHEFDANQAADVVVNGIQVANVGAVSGIGLAFEKEYHPESDDTLTTDLAHETNGVTSSLATLIPGQDPSTLREIEEYRKWVSETPDGGWAKNVRDSQVFIDNAAEAISMDMSRGYLVRCRGTQKGILIPFSQIDYASPGKTLELSRVYPDRTKAGLGVAEAIIASSGKGFQFFYSYYLAPEGLIAPTVFNESSSPRIFAGIQKKDEQMRAAANDAAVALTWVAVGMLVSKAASETIAFTNRMVAKPANPFKTTKAVTPPKNDKSFFKKLAKSLRAHALAHAMKGVSDAVPALGRIGASSIGVTRLISQPLGRPTIAEAPTVVARPAITQSTQPTANKAVPGHVGEVRTIETPQAARAVAPVGGVADHQINMAVERGFVEWSGQIGEARIVRPLYVPASSDAINARSEFKGPLRNNYAQALMVDVYGQVHHAIEVQVLSRYPGVYTPGEINQFQNMRGIPPELGRRTQLHNSKIREILDRHYVALDAEIVRRGLKSGNADYNALVRQWMDDARAEIDWALGQFFSEQRAVLNWTPSP